MTTKDLNFIKEVRNQIESGISKPLDISKAFAMVAPLESPDMPIRAKITKIQWFMTFNYQDELLKASEQPSEYWQVPTISTGETEFHSHHEDFGEEKQVQKVDNEMQGFLSAEEKRVLANPKTGTELNVPKRTRKKK